MGCYIMGVLYIGGAIWGAVFVRAPVSNCFRCMNSSTIVVYPWLPSLYTFTSTIVTFILFSVSVTLQLSYFLLFQCQITFLDLACRL